MDELEALQQVIQDLHELISILSDPKGTAVASQCLTQLTRVQQEMMANQQQQGGAQGGAPDEAAMAALMQQLGGGGIGGGAPMGPPQGVPGYQ
jgi:hypothetical protein